MKNFNNEEWNKLYKSHYIKNSHLRRDVFLFYTGLDDQNFPLPIEKSLFIFPDGQEYFKVEWENPSFSLLFSCEDYEGTLITLNVLNEKYYTFRDVKSLLEHVTLHYQTVLNFII